MYGICRLNSRAELARNQINICGTIINSLSGNESAKRLEEFNPSLKLKSSVDSYWEFEEVEYKLDILPTHKFSFLEFKRLFENIDIANYESGEISRETTFERYLSLETVSLRNYIVILGKKNWRKKRALKTKQLISDNILTRRVNICPLSIENFKSELKKLMYVNLEEIKVEFFPAFYKKKERIVFVHKLYGYVFGVSYSEAKTMTHRKSRFNQLEIEYWSKLVETDSDKEIDKEQLKRVHVNLVEEIKTHLRINGFCTLRGGTKYEWLSCLGKKTRKFKLENLL